MTDRTLHNTKLAKPFRDSSRISRGIDWLTVRICTLHLSLEARFTQIGISGRGPALCHVSLLGYIWRKIARSGGKPRRSLSCRLDRYRPKGTEGLPSWSAACSPCMANRLSLSTNRLPKRGSSGRASFPFLTTAFFFLFLLF